MPASLNILPVERNQTVRMKPSSGLITLCYGLLEASAFTRKMVFGMAGLCIRVAFT